MKEKCFSLRFSIATVICCLFNLANAFSQSGFVSLGSSVSAQQGNISYSIGQSAYVNSKTAGGTMEFGVQQPYQYVAITAVSNLNSSFDIEIYPNPTHETVSIKNLSRLMANGKLNVLIMGRTGQVIAQEVIRNERTKMDVQKYLPGTYFLNIFQKGKLLKSYKFIKL